MEHVLNMVIITIMLAQSAVAGVIVVVCLSKLAAFKAQVNDYVAQMSLFVSPVAEGQPSPLAATAEVGAEMIARAVMARAKMTFAGLSSGVVRQEKAVEGDIAEDMARMSPIVDGLLDSFPALKKTLRKNPALLDMALSKLGQLQGNRSGAVNGGQASSPIPGKISN